MTPAVIAGIDRMTQKVLQGDTVGAMPFELASVRTCMGPDRHADAVPDQVTQHALDRPEPIEEIEDQTDHALDLLVGIEREGSREQLHVAAGGMIKHLTPFGFVEQALIHAAAQDVQLGFAHGPFQPEQQTIVVIGRIIQAVLIGQQSPEDGTQLQELMPIFIRACQPAHLQAQDETDVVETDLRQQILKAKPSLSRLTATSLVFIDDFHAILGPAQQRGPMPQGVLPIRGLTMFQDLLRGRLSDIDDGFTLSVPILDLQRWHGEGRIHRCPDSRSRRLAKRGRSHSLGHGLNGLHASPPSARRAGDDGPPARSGPGRAAGAGWRPTAPRDGSRESLAFGPLQMGGAQELTWSNMVHFLVARAGVAGTTVPAAITPTR